MGVLTNIMLSEQDKDSFIDALSYELPMLRAKADISQEEIANLIGVSRQTYGAIERRTRKMSWSTYLSLVFFYDYNKKTHDMLRNTRAFPYELVKLFNDGDNAFDWELLFTSDTKRILGALDEKAVSTVKTVMMVEYLRCSKSSSEAVLRFFEGINFNENISGSEKNSTAKVLQNIKRKNHE